MMGYSRGGYNLGGVYLPNSILFGEKEVVCMYLYSLFLFFFCVLVRVVVLSTCLESEKSVCVCVLVYTMEIFLRRGGRVGRCSVVGG